MRSFFDKIFLRTNNLDYISENIKNLAKKTPSKKIFDAINSYSLDSEIRYVGGCIRKIINKEKVDDIDLATNLEPKKVCDALKKNNIKYFESGIEHGTVTAIEDGYRFEITSLRKDILTDGRHAKVEFSSDWKADALRRDFTINAIYSDKDGNLFDPFNGKNDLEQGIVTFIGEASQRIQEDYLRILRYLRFFSNYSKQPHKLDVIKALKMNIGGVSKLSKERLLDELRKLITINKLENLLTDKLSLEIILIIFPELKKIKNFLKLDKVKKDLLKEKDFILLISLIIIDDSDNADYFLYKYKISKKNHKRIKIIDNFYKEKINTKTFTKNNMDRVFYYQGKQAIIDILIFKIFKSKKIDDNLIELVAHYQSQEVPKMPISGDFLIKKYEVPAGKKLGEKLKLIEKKWVNNNFRISEQQVEDIAKN